jgi:hypothetical protein
MSDLCGTVAGMVTPKGSMSTEGETLQVSVLPCRYWYAPFCCVCLGCCAVEFGSSGGTYELPCTLVFELKYPLFLSDFNEIWIFPTDFRKILKHKISRKSVQWEPSFYMRTDRRTNMTMPIVSLRKFANAPKYETSSCTAITSRNKQYPSRELLGTCDGDNDAIHPRLCLRYLEKQ